MKILKWTTLLGVASTALLMSVQVIAVPPPKDTGGNTGGGNEDCPGGTTQVAKFETTNNGSYNVEGSVNDVAISGATLTGGSWSSTTPISHVIVKGASGNLIKSANYGGT